MKKIFVSIAAYRDPELLPTLKDLLDNCSEPDNLHICIGWQHSLEDSWDNLDLYRDDPRFTILDIDYKEAKGPCWIRAEIQKHYNSEDYYFQLDSHHRLTKNWDVTLKDFIHYFQCKDIKKPLITGYIPGYFPDSDPDGRVNETWGLNIQRFMPSGVIFLQPHHIEKWEELKEPFPARFISAHFIFTLGGFVKEVPYDPELYFHGEESSLAARAYTFGYDLFHPHKVVAWHEYTRSGKKRHWDDSSKWAELDQASYARYRMLMGTDPGCTPCKRNSIAPNYFGNQRTFEDYERYIGINFKTRQIHIETVNNELPPIKGDFESGLTNRQKYCIDIYKGSLTEEDYDTIVVAFLDEEGKDLYRQDVSEIEIKGLFTQEPDNKFIHIWREFENNKRPHSWRVWPHSKSKGWMQRIEQILSHE